MNLRVDSELHLSPLGRNLDVFLGCLGDELVTVSGFRFEIDREVGRDFKGKVLTKIPITQPLLSNMGFSRATTANVKGVRSLTEILSEGFKGNQPLSCIWNVTEKYRVIHVSNLHDFVMESTTFYRNLL